MGRHVKLIGPETMKSFNICLFVSELLFPFIVGFTKFSILFFYYRIFGTTTRIRIPLAILALIVTGWAIAIVRFDHSLRISEIFDAD